VFVRVVVLPFTLKDTITSTLLLLSGSAMSVILFSTFAVNTKFIVLELSFAVTLMYMLAHHMFSIWFIRSSNSMVLAFCSYCSVGLGIISQVLLQLSDMAFTIPVARCSHC